MKSIVTLILSVLSLFAGAQTLIQRNVATGFDTPWEILWGPDNHLWMTERIGNVVRVNPQTGSVQVVLSIAEVFEGNERGLMGMVLHPDFQTTPHVYLAYTYGSGSTTVKVVRYQWTGSQLVSPVVIIDNITGNSTHDGCRLVIHEGKLFVTTGDAQQQDRPQNASSRNGKILRLNLDGTIPSDNPVSGNPYWSLGHRNPQGLVVANAIMYSSEHGPDSDDEVNIITKAGNYGWPNVYGFCDQQSEMTFCQQNNVKEPIRAWTPTLAVAGIDYYNNALIPQFANSLLMVSLKAGRLTQLKLNPAGTSVTEEKSIYSGQFGRLRDLCVAPDGRVFIVTSNKDGRGNPGPNDDRIIELKPQGSGISQIELESTLVYPNPADSREPFRIFFPFTGDYELEWYDVKGSLIRKQSEKNTALAQSDLSGMEPGVYILKIGNGKALAVKKIVIQ
ncbi:MAG: PQQ-dependent sugar dehydrogenase [Bacteroidota bacterium]